MKKYKTALLLISASLLTSACGSDSNDVAPEALTGQFSLAVSDSPMAGISHVGMVMSELVLTDSKGVVLRHSLQDMAFNLLDYQGMDSHMVISGIELPAGHYHDVHINIVQGDGNQGCYVEDGQGRHGLKISDGHLPVEDFEIVHNQHHSMTLEIDLYRGLSHGQDEYQLHHEGMWSIDNSHMGHLLGEVDPQWIADCETAYIDKTPVDAQFHHLAYLYANDVTDISQMADMGITPPAGMNSPVAVSRMMQDSAGNWSFTMGYLPEGEYRVGYSCLGHLDDPVTDDISEGEFKMFKDSGSITIDAGNSGGQQTTHECGNGNGGHHGGHR
ncbi:DUF4382 domain-containing protein [Shewanella sp. KX20019]|uniref:DUF4382 domain-containing protein n=1 Tax=Shewanella sp. KX20019 TaxID=2803864 RepID=UPI001925CDF8|nr:DUF4382 domain-containing protein [Shewanella sp. KX20019]QQX81592.1 DUF4382 domain-containing protein [Shewanella sp. KX20019]